MPDHTINTTAVIPRPVIPNGTYFIRSGHHSSGMYLQMEEEGEIVVKRERKSNREQQVRFCSCIPCFC